MKYWFISDWHFGHDRDFIWGKRGYSSVQEHDEDLISKFNSKVGTKDITYFLGDFCFNKEFDKYLSRLNGNFIILCGNHDKDFFRHLSSISCKTKQKIIKFTTGFIDISLQGKPITLCHFAMHSWNKSHFNAGHLYGHHHYATDFGGKTLNVTVDGHNGYPYSEEEITSILESLPNNWDYIEKKRD